MVETFVACLQLLLNRLSIAQEDRAMVDNMCSGRVAEPLCSRREVLQYVKETAAVRTSSKQASDVMSSRPSIKLVHKVQMSE